MSNLVVDQSILDCLYDGLYVLDLERRIVFWNQASERLTGFSAEEVLGRSCSDNILVHVGARGEQLCLGSCPMSEAMADGQVHEAEVFLHHKDGHRVPVVVRAAPLRDAGGNIVGAVEVFGDNSLHLATRQRIQELEKLAMLDELTRLPNRRYLLEQIRSRLHELRRANWPFGLLFIDLDHFKQVNDSCGHLVGDQVLQMVGRTLERNSRAFDVVGRWGGEEFLAVVPNVDLERLRTVGERYQTLVAKSELIHQGQPVRVTISVGGTIARQEDSLQLLLQRADQNLYAAKLAGRNRVNAS
ncbi:MAG: sensor domain-containing diguanylate cyclase [Thermodesulfobacteriota bacterium]